MPSLDWPASDSWRGVVGGLRRRGPSRRLGTVADGDCRGVLFAAAEVADLTVEPTLRAEMSCHEVVAVLDLAAVDGDEDVLRLDAGLGRAAAGDDGADDDAAVREAVHAADSGGLLGLELDADGAADDLVLRSDEVVVDLGDGCWTAWRSRRPLSPADWV